MAAGIALNELLFTGAEHLGIDPSWITRGRLVTGLGRGLPGGAGWIGASGKGRTGRSRVNKVTSPPNAGPNTGFKRDPVTGRISGYTEFDGAGRPVKRFRGQGKPHGGVEPPVILEPKKPRQRPVVPRKPRPEELPLGY